MKIWDNSHFMLPYINSIAEQIVIKREWIDCFTQIPWMGLVYFGLGKNFRFRIGMVFPVDSKHVPISTFWFILKEIMWSVWNSEVETLNNQSTRFTSINAPVNVYCGSCWSWPRWQYMTHTNFNFQPRLKMSTWQL